MLPQPHVSLSAHLSSELPTESLGALMAEDLHLARDLLARLLSDADFRRRIREQLAVERGGLARGQSAPAATGLRRPAVSIQAGSLDSVRNGCGGDTRVPGVTDDADDQQLGSEPAGVHTAGRESVPSTKDDTPGYLASTEAKTRGAARGRAVPAASERGLGRPDFPDEGGAAAGLVSFRPVAVATPARLGELTVSQFLEQIVIPGQRHTAAPDTISQKRTHCRRWEEYWMNYPVGTATGGAMAVSAITAWHLDRFRTFLSESGESARNANKHVGSVAAVLARAAELGALPAAPRLRQLPARAAAPKVYLSWLPEDDELGQLYQAADGSTWPRRPGLLWETRAAIVLYASLGFRTQELIAYKPTGRVSRLTWGGVQLSEGRPLKSPLGHHAAAAHGWVCYTPWKQRGKKPDPLAVPLPEVAALHLRRVRPPNPADSDPVFAWPICSKRFYRAFEELFRRAGLKPRHPQVKEYQLAHLRKTCETWHNTISTSRIGEQITGHAPRSVSSRSYDNEELRLVEHLETTFPPYVPTAWLREL